MKTVSVMAMIFLAILSCKKNSSPGNNNDGNNNGNSTDSVYNPIDPTVAGSIGFFLSDWSGKTFITPDVMTGTVPSGSVTDSLTINVNKVITKVPQYVFGNNSNLWMGQIVTQASLMGYITDLSPNVIRAPAGSVSDVYFFNQASAPPADVPDSLFDTNGNKVAAGYWYGHNSAGWTFSIDNYYQLLQQTNSTGIITVNYAYARYGTSADPVATAAHLAADWVRYDNGRSKFWEIGNESGGVWEASYEIDVTKNKDGQPQFITGELYGKHFNVFADSMRAAAQSIGKTIYIGAQLLDAAPASWQNSTDQTWNQGVLSQAGSSADFFIVHDYFTPFNTNSGIADILSSATSVPSNAMGYLQQQMSASGVGIKPVALTEWNISAVGSKQMVSYVAGIHAALTLGNLLKNKFGEASRWDLANGWSNGDDMGMFSNSAGSGAEPGAPAWNPRPAFYYLYYFRKFFGDRMVYDTLKRINPDIITFSSTFSSGNAGTIIINTGAQNHIVSVDFQHYPAGSKYYWYVLTGGTDNGNFSGQVYVNGTGPTSATGGPLNYSVIKAYSAALNGTIKISVPALSVIYLVADKK
ncbi:MAG TPA: hypothetical protein VMT76_14970 [Puia sp.]|nr:hypothetical protein [Puia sp.]